MDKASIYTLKPRQLMDLLSIGAEADAFDSGELISDEQIRGYFASLVQRKIPNDASIVDSLLIFLGENERYGKRVSGRSLSEVLLDAATEPDLLRVIKDYSKKIYQTTVSKGENSIAAAIYYAAIAAALVHHDAKISEHPWQTLKTAFEDLLAKPWMTPPLTGLLQEARERCETEQTNP